MSRDVGASRSARRVGLALAAVVIGGVAWLASDWGDGANRPIPPGDSRPWRASVEEAGASAGRPSAPDPAAPDRPRLPDGALVGPIGEPRYDRIPLCDDRNWGMLDGLVREVRDGELIVEETAWGRAGASTRAGVASWASKCRLDDAGVVVRGADSGRELGYYDAASGYERVR